MSWRQIDKQLQVRLIEKLVHILEVARERYRSE